MTPRAPSGGFTARWKAPFAAGMTESDVARVLGLPLFQRMDPVNFAVRAPLEGIVRNDCALRRLSAGQVLMRQGDLGSSAFLVVSGELRVSLRGILGDDHDYPDEELRPESPPGILGRIWRNLRPSPERVPRHLLAVPAGEAPVVSPHALVVYFQDLPVAARRDEEPPRLGPGTFFGEMSAIGRTPRSATVEAATDCEVVEIRAQGVRDLRVADPGLSGYIFDRYRETSLQRDHFRHSPLFSLLSSYAQDALRAAAVFETHSCFDWQSTYQTGQQDQRRAGDIAREPLICDHGQPAQWLYLVCSGFVRRCRVDGDGETTLGYLAKGALFGDDALLNHLDDRAREYSARLRALGHVELVRFPLDVVAELVAGNGKAIAWLRENRARRPASVAGVGADTLAPAAVDLLEALGTTRHYNGTSVMTIDLERCTRCDDCVRACSQTHNGQPRFVRHGPTSQGFLFPNACMHCMDPVCLVGCPTGAIARDDDGGQVVVNDQLCIGCSSCANTCPYDNIRMVERRHHGAEVLDPGGYPLLRAAKCDLCHNQPGGPACVSACPHDALSRDALPGLLDLARRREGA